MSERDEKAGLGPALHEARRRNRMLSTSEAADLFGLSQAELRRGFQEGIYPALLVGAGNRKRLRWRPDLLEAAILREIENNGGGEGG